MSICVRNLWTGTDNLFHRKDKSFRSGLFTLIKQSTKWDNQENTMLLVGLIPKLVAIHALLYFKEKSDDLVQSKWFTNNRSDRGGHVYILRRVPSHRQC
jgi:hypothetical protein